MIEYSTIESCLRAVIFSSPWLEARGIQNGGLVIMNGEGEDGADKAAVGAINRPLQCLYDYYEGEVGEGVDGYLLVFCVEV